MMYRMLIPYVLALLLALLNPKPTEAIDLADFWDFSDPALRSPELDPNGLRINILYNVSDYITSPMVYFSVYDWNCSDGRLIEEWFAPSLVQPAVGFQRGDGSGEGQIEVEVNVAIESFEDGPDDIALYYQEDNQERYKVNFCLKVGVQTEENPPTLVDSSETQIQVLYDLTSGFALDVEVTPIRDEVNAEDAYGVDGFFCDASGVELNEEQKRFMGAPGSELSVCVIPDAEALASGSFSIGSLDTFDWIRVDPSGVEVRQSAVSYGQASSDGLTELFCGDDGPGSGCEFKSILKANFFSETIPTPPPTMPPTQPPDVPDYEFVGEGDCLGGDGMIYDRYRFLTPGGTLFDCPDQCDQVRTLLEDEKYPERVRGFEHDGNRCQCLIDGGYGDRTVPGFGYVDYGITSTSPTISGSVINPTRPGSLVCFRYSPPQPTNFYFLGEGSCVDSDGNGFDHYRSSTAHGYEQCPGVCSQVASGLSNFPERVRGYEHDGKCNCLVDSGSDGDRGLSGFTFVGATSAISAISPVIRAQPEIEYIWCFKYTYDWYEGNAQYVSDSSLTIEGAGNDEACSASGTTNTDVIALYDVNQKTGLSTNSCLNLCESIVDKELLAITIVKQDDEDAPADAPYSGQGNYQCQCHVVLLDGKTDQRVLDAISYDGYLSGQGFAGSDHTQSATVISGTSSEAGSYCYRYNHYGLAFVGEGGCSDNDGNTYDGYQVPSTGSYIDKCPTRCKSLANELEALGVPEHVRGVEYDGLVCKCLVDGGYVDRGLSGWTFIKTGGGKSAVSPIVDFQPQTGMNCFMQIYQYYENRYYVGSVDTVGYGGTFCTDVDGDALDSISVYDVNQRTGQDTGSCLELCEDILGSGTIAITVVRRPNESRPSNAPYTGAGDFQCQCHLPLDGPSDPLILAAQGHTYRSGQGFASAEADQPGTVIVGYNVTGQSGSQCYRYSPPSLLFVGAGRCTDEVGNQYNSYQVPLTADNVDDCPSHCESLASTFATQNFPEFIRGMEYDGVGCYCLVDQGYGERTVAGWEFIDSGNIAARPNPTPAISPIFYAEPLLFPDLGCYRQTSDGYNAGAYSSGYMTYLGGSNARCTGSGAVETNTLQFYDVNQRYYHNPSSCTNICQEFVGTALLGVTLTRNMDPGTTDATAPYTALGNYQCDCHVSSIDTSAYQSAISAHQFGTGQDFKQFGSGSSASSITGTTYDLGSQCYRWIPSRRQLEEQALANMAKMSDVISLTDPEHRKKTSRTSPSARRVTTQEEASKDPKNAPRPFLRSAAQDREDEGLTVARELQTGVTTISGAGQATLKFARRVYRRNLLTGEDGWTTKTVESKRDLQIGGASAFDMSLEIQTFKYGPYRTRSSVERSATTKSWQAMVWVSTAVAMVVHVLV